MKIHKEITINYGKTYIHEFIKIENLDTNNLFHLNLIFITQTN